MKKNHGNKWIARQLARRPVFLVAVIAGLALALSGHAEPNNQNTLHFDIPAQTLSDSLAELADHAGLKLLYPADRVGAKLANAVAGDYTPQQALEILLQDSGLIYRFTDETSVTLEQKQENELDAIMKLVASDNYRVAASDEEQPYTGPVEQMDMTVQGMEVGYNVLNASTATKTDTPIMETPMSVQVVPEAVLKDQQAFRMQDALKNVSGVQQKFDGGGFDSFIARGFELGTFQYRNGIRIPSLNFDFANVQQVEVLKGPASTLYGRTEPGGMINAVTKRPQVDPYYSLEQRFGSYDYYRTQASATGAVNADESLLYRFDLSYLNP